MDELSLSDNYNKAQGLSDADKHSNLKNPAQEEERALMCIPLQLAAIKAYKGMDENRLS